MRVPVPVPGALLAVMGVPVPGALLAVMGVPVPGALQPRDFSMHERHNGNHLEANYPHGMLYTALYHTQSLYTIEIDRPIDYTPPPLPNMVSGLESESGASWHYLAVG
jgi:hypothetical protein